MVQHEEGPDGQPRFTMLETIREFSSERLSDTDEAEPYLTSGGRLPWLQRVAAERENLRAA